MGPAKGGGGPNYRIVVSAKLPFSTVSSRKKVHFARPETSAVFHAGVTLFATGELWKSYDMQTDSTFSPGCLFLLALVTIRAAIAAAVQTESVRKAQNWDSQPGNYLSALIASADRHACRGGLLPGSSPIDLETRSPRARLRQLSQMG